MKFIPIQEERFSVRHVEGPAEVPEEAWVAVVLTTRKALRHLSIYEDTSKHLFVTVVGANNLLGDDATAVGLYHSGIQHIAIPAGVDGVEDKKDWLHEIKISAAHEVVHYWQELNGKLDGSQACEDEAEKIANEIVGEPKPKEQ